MKLIDLPEKETLQQPAAIAKLMAVAFSQSRTPRSHAYKLGVQSALIAVSTGQSLPAMYEAGTVAFDAYYAGADEGRAIWARTTAVPACAQHRNMAPANSADLLAAELIHSGEVIAVLVAALTPEQLQAVRTRLEQAGVVDQYGPVSRIVERSKVLVQTGFQRPSGGAAVVPTHSPEASLVH